ncbi:MAG: basic amino acid ABC transporter substrate-binding protein [Cellulosilyticaceae bacterium]
MKKSQWIKIASTMLIGVLALGSFTGCSKDASSVEAIKEKGKIVMGTNAAFPPFEEVEGDKIVGFDVEIAELIAAKLGVELEIMDMEFGQLLGATSTGKIDFVAAAMTVKPDRAAQVDFSNSYFKSKQVLIVQEGETSIATADDLAGKKVGVQLGTTGDLYASDLEGVEVIPYDKAAMAVADLGNGKVDAVLVDEEPAKLIVGNQSGVKLLDATFVDEEYALAVKKGNEELVEVINEVIKEIQADGTYDALYAEFFGTIE